MAPTTSQSRALLLPLLAIISAVATTSLEYETLLELPSSVWFLSPKTPCSSTSDLIYALNLHPHDALPCRPGGSNDAISVGTLVERPISLTSQVVGRSDGTDELSVGVLGHHAGYFCLPSSHDARMLYLLFESRHHKKDNPVVIWLTGGPGCNIELALFCLFHITDNLSVVWNDFGSDKETNLIYVDQPTGTEFNYSSDSCDTCHNEASVSNDLYEFL